MTPTLVPQIVRGSFLPLDEALKRDKLRFSPDEVQELVGGCIVCAAVLDKISELNNRALDHGMEGGKLLALFNESAKAVKDGLALFAKVRIIVESVSPPPEGKEHSLRLLDAITRQAEDVLKDYQSTLSWLNVPPPRWDDVPDSREGEASVPNGYETIDDILARAKATGDI